MSRPENLPVVQRFSDEYIERCRELSPQEIVRFLEDYRILFGLARMRDCSTLPHPSGTMSTSRVRIDPDNPSSDFPYDLISIVEPGEDIERPLREHDQPIPQPDLQ